MFAPLLFAAAAVAASPPPPPAEPSPWVTGLGELLPVGAHVAITRAERNGVPTGQYEVRALTAAEAGAIRAGAAPYRGRFDELTNARARLEAASRRELGMGPGTPDFQAVEEMQNRLILLRRELQRAERIMAAADALRVVVACGHGRMSVCTSAAPDTDPGDTETGEPAPPAGAAGPRNPDARGVLDEPDNRPDPSATDGDVIHLPLAEIVQVSESPARFAERTGAAPPVSDFSDPDAAPSEDE